MNDGITRIQRRSAPLPLLAILSLLMTGASIFCIIFPYIKKFDDVLFYAFLAVGGIGLLYFSYMLASSIYRIFIPQNAMLIDENGFCDYTVCQRGTGFVPWSNVESIKVFGPEDELLLGVTLKSIDRLEEIPDKRVYKELSDNMKTGVPEIILKQSDVKMPLRQLERVMLRAAGLADPQPTPKTDGATKELPLEDIVPALKTEAAKPENAEKADDFEALADLFARKDERREPKAEAAEAPAQKDEAPSRAAENAEKSEKSIDELLDELAATLKSPSGSGADKSAETGYNKKLEALLEELKAGAPSDDAPDDKK